MAELTIKIKILPNSSRNEIIKTPEGVKIKITTQPIEGKANKAVVEFLSKEFRIPKTSIEIIKGNTSKEKTIQFKIQDEEKIKSVKEKLS